MEPAALAGDRRGVVRRSAATASRSRSLSPTRQVQRGRRTQASDGGAAPPVAGVQRGASATAPSAWRLLPAWRRLEFRETVEERLLRRDRARRACCSALRPARRPAAVRHQHLAGDLPDAASCYPARSPCSCWSIITFYAGELVWRERETGSTRSTTRCRCRRGCRSWQALALMLVPVAAAGRADAVRHRHPGCKGLHALRARAVRRMAVRPASWWTTGWCACSRSPCTRSSIRSTSATSS